MVKLVVDVVDLHGDKFCALNFPGFFDYFFEFGVEVSAELGQMIIFNKDAVIQSEAVVVSGLPGRGHLAVMSKLAADFWLRPPSWAPRDRVQAWRNGHPIEPCWGGPGFDYLGFAGATPGERLELTWPLVRFTQRIALKYTDNSQDEQASLSEGEAFEYTWTGSTVTSVQPDGEWLRLYG